VRIGAGTARGRTLKGPKDATRIRPTADRVRESIFNVLGQFFDGEKVLDLYAGTGAFGLEAISRGASHATLVDQDREALGLCRTNTDALAFSGQVEIRSATVEQAVSALGRSGRKFDLVFADPPYAAQVVQRILEWVASSDVLSPTGVLVIEHDKREDAPQTHGALHREDQRSFGDTRVSFYRRQSAGGDN
jgi:16S rRNA (guanine966-N2)-methyltransferase